jgi:hypothetical protein
MKSKTFTGQCLRWAAAALAVLLSACAAPRQAATLADITSAHLNALNTEMQAYVSSADDARKNDALRLASTRQYYQSIDDLAGSEVRAWRANPDDPKNKNKVAAFDSLQQDAMLDMAMTDSSLKQQGNAVTALEASYGQVTYDATQIPSIIANLQLLAKRSSGSTELTTFYAFSSVVIADAKSGLKASTVNPNGVAPKTIK